MKDRSEALGIISAGIAELGIALLPAPWPLVPWAKAADHVMVHALLWFSGIAIGVGVTLLFTGSASDLAERLAQRGGRS